MRKTKAESQQTRTNILQAALQVFYEKGLSQASLNDVAKVAGVTRGAIYWHFKNKEALFEGLFQQYYTPMEQQLQAIVHTHNSDSTQTDPLDRLLAQIIIHCQHLSEQEDLQKFASIMSVRREQTPINQGITQWIQQYTQRFEQLLLGALKERQQQKKLPPHLDAVQAIAIYSASLLGISIQWLSYGQKFDYPSQIVLMTRLWLDSLQGDYYCAKIAH